MLTNSQPERKIVPATPRGARKFRQNQSARVPIRTNNYVRAKPFLHAKPASRQTEPSLSASRFGVMPHPCRVRNVPLFWRICKRRQSALSRTLPRTMSATNPIFCGPDYLRGSETRMISPLLVPTHTLAEPLDVMSIVVGSPRAPRGSACVGVKVESLFNASPVKSAARPSSKATTKLVSLVEAHAMGAPKSIIFAWSRPPDCDTMHASLEPRL